MCFLFHAWAFDDFGIWISEKLKFGYLKNEKSFLNEIKNIFYGFPLDLQNKLSKM